MKNVREEEGDTSGSEHRGRTPEPDVVIEVASPDRVFHRLLKNTRTSGKRASANMSGVGAVCGECTALPMISGKTNISVGCGGSRRRAFPGECDMLLALPVEQS